MQPEPIPAILLAAGASTRLGSPKQLLSLPCNHCPPGETLLDRAVRLAHEAGASPVFAVLGAHAKIIQRDAKLKHCTVLLNEAWAEGMASSLRCGVRAVMRECPHATGALLMVCDQPALSAEHLTKLVQAHRAAPSNIIASSYSDRRGVPIVVPPAIFTALLQLKGNQGARSVLASATVAIDEVPFPGGEIDIDTSEDAAHWQSLKR